MKKMLNLDQWFRRCRLKIFPIYNYGGHSYQQSEAYLHEEGNMRNISVKYVEFESVVWENMLFQEISYLELW